MAGGGGEENKMIDKNRLKNLCGIGIYNNIPVEDIEDLKITHCRMIDLLQPFG